MTDPATTAAAAQPQPPLHGLANMGNSCYLNSAVQALFHSTPFKNLFRTDDWRRWRHDDRKGLALVDTTESLVRQLAAPGSLTVVPREFLQAFIPHARSVNSEFRFGSQADATEAVQIILDGIHTQLSREVRMDISGAPANPAQEELVKSMESWSTFYKKEYSPIVSNYYGQTQARITCNACGAASMKYEPWCTLKLSIPNADKVGAPAPTLQNCLTHSFATEELGDYTCDTCKERGKSVMTHKISRFPPYLILSLKRFTNMGAKVRARIVYDENSIDLSALRAWPSFQPGMKYRVVSTIEHLGGSIGGHYLMRTRAPTGEWLVIDDARVSKSSIGGAAGPDTYMLFLEAYQETRGSTPTPSKETPHP